MGLRESTTWGGVETSVRVLEFEGLFLLDYKGTLSQVVGTLGDQGPEEGVCVRKGTVEDVEKGQIVGFGVIPVHE
jgi:hypothetical protein